MEVHANAFVANAKGQWEQLVKVSRSIAPKDRQQAVRTLAEAAGIGRSTLLRKLEAINSARAAGLDEEKIISMGQRQVLAKFQNDKRAARTDSQVVLKWLVAPELRDAAMGNSLRVGRLLKFTTSNEWWTWLNAQIELATDEEILHSAGVVK